MFSSHDVLNQTERLTFQIEYIQEYNHDKTFDHILRMLYHN